MKCIENKPTIIMIFIAALFLLFNPGAFAEDNKKLKPHNVATETETTGVLGGNDPLTFENEDINLDVLTEALKLKQEFNIKLDEEK